jgi:hypothetical protein
VLVLACACWLVSTYPLCCLVYRFPSLRIVCCFDSTTLVLRFQQSNVARQRDGEEAGVLL